MNHPEVIRFLAAHHGVASVDQLRGLNFGKHALVRARRQGLLVSPARGVVALAGRELSFEGRAVVAQLAAGGEAFVSGPSAGVLHGLRGMPTSRIEVSIKQTRRVDLPAWCRVFRTSWIDEERDVIVRADGLRVASPLRMMFGLAAQFNQHRFERAAEDVWHKNLVTPAEAADYLADIRRSGRTGVTRFEKWLEKTSVRTRPSHSGLELDFVDMIDRVGLPTPKRQHPLLLATGRVDPPRPRVARRSGSPSNPVIPGGTAVTSVNGSIRPGTEPVTSSDGESFVTTRRRSGIPCGTARELLAIYRRRIADLRGSVES